MKMREILSENWIDDLQAKRDKKNKKIEPLKREYDELEEKIKKFEEEGNSYETTKDEDMKKAYRRRYELLRKIHKIENSL